MRLCVFAYVNVCLTITEIIGRHYAVASPPCCGGSEYNRLDELQKSWSPGDRIVCAKPLPLRTDHHLLVVDRQDIIHVVQLGDGRYYVCVENYKDFRWTRCRNYGQGKFGEAAVQRAREWHSVDREPVYFHARTCNSRHYVDYWAEGERKALCPSYRE